MAIHLLPTNTILKFIPDPTSKGLEDSAAKVQKAKQRNNQTTMGKLSGTRQSVTPFKLMQLNSPPAMVKILYAVYFLL